jgi:hypothetical protein
VPITMRGLMLPRWKGLENRPGLVLTCGPGLMAAELTTPYYPLPQFRYTLCIEGRREQVRLWTPDDFNGLQQLR